jgi:RNA polymerase sigma-70 factor (ECF subfamily)
LVRRACTLYTHFNSSSILAAVAFSLDHVKGLMASDSTTQLQAWLDRMNAGDADARAGLLNHACERLRRLTRRLLREFPAVHRLEETDDVLSKTVLRLMRRLQNVTVANVAEFFGLATRETRRELIDLARRYGRLPAPLASPSDNDSSTASDVTGPEWSDSTNDPQRLAFWSEFHSQVESLPAEERDVFDHIWYMDLTQEETAQALGISRAAVQRLWLAARLRLQAALGGSGISP